MNTSRGERQNTRVFIENLPSGVRKNEIGKEFYNFGEIAKIYLMYDVVGSGFVEFVDTEDAAYAADQMNGASFGGSRLRTRLTQGGVARGRGNYEGDSRPRGRGYSSSYGERYSSNRAEGSGHSFRDDYGNQSRRGGYPRRSRGGRDRFESRDSGGFSGRSRPERDWEYPETSDRESSFRGRRFSSRDDRDFEEEFQPRKRNDFGRDQFSRSNYRRMGDRDHDGSRQFNVPAPFQKNLSRSAEYNDIIAGVKPSRYMSKRERETQFADEFDSDKFSYRKPKRTMPDSDDEDYHQLRDRSRSPVIREKKEQYSTYYEPKPMSYVTEDGMHRSHRPKHSEKPMREDKDFVSSHRRHRSREETDRF